jgi:hypothetical protein
MSFLLLGCDYRQGKFSLVIRDLLLIRFCCSLSAHNDGMEYIGKKLPSRLASSESSAPTQSDAKSREGMITRGRANSSSVDLKGKGRADGRFSPYPTRSPTSVEIGKKEDSPDHKASDEDDEEAKPKIARGKSVARSKSTKEPRKSEAELQADLANVEEKFRKLDNPPTGKKTLERELPELGRSMLSNVLGKNCVIDMFYLIIVLFISGNLGTEDFKSFYEIAKDSHMVWVKIPSLLVKNTAQVRGWMDDEHTLPIAAVKGIAKIPVESLLPFVRDRVDGKIEAKRVNPESLYFN